ncbi:MAG: YdcF family protein [Anaerolineaceae bacterium]
MIFTILMLWACSTAPVATTLARSLEWQYTYPEEVPQADAIIVLGGGTEPAVSPRKYVEINSAGDRVFAAAQLYRDGKAPILILSGGNINWLNNGSSTPADQMAEILTFLDVPSSAMILENTSKNTYENALNTKEIITENGFKTVLLITSAMHMPRSVMLFEKQGVSVIPIPVDYSVVEDVNESQSFLDTFYGLLPNVGNLAVTTNVMKEYIGIWTYSLQGQIQSN